MKFILMNGSSCSGKSTIIKNIMDNKDMDNIFHLSYDKVKWSFAGYKSEKHFNDVENVVFKIAESVFEMKYDVLSDSTLYRKSRNRLIELAKKHDYEVIEINLEADYELLSKRFDERVKSASLNPNSKISNTSKERFKELFDIYSFEKSKTAIEVRTDNQSIEDALMEVYKNIK